ncbi:DUF1697 domain-containing protein [Sphingobacterium haloxyli]|uniref:DUF1697 domain-containing protein n=1 Tax=Sphingobacterium haloxyli TaxID=2100533 RepID=A0A2S9J7H2_9SPHI|nr:DUF1697 domain-containing protein [Sphingobacterium haloxyli]PRD48722.1 hypothetical protein C5745_05575 [Sphingobacterium haloxyli]
MSVSNTDNKFCAFLRGVNVKGTNMKMAEVCSVFERAGMRDVSSVLASGNILFSSEKKAQELKKVLEKVMSEHFSYEAYLFVKSRQEIETICYEIPFENDSQYHIYGFVGVDGVAKTLMSEFYKSKKVVGEKAQLVGCRFYWKVPRGNTLDSEFGKILGRKNLKSFFTSRNINTFEKVLKRM